VLIARIISCKNYERNVHISTLMLTFDKGSTNLAEKDKETVSKQTLALNGNRAAKYIDRE
jgi:hypothetical protein